MMRRPTRRRIAICACAAGLLGSLSIRPALAVTKTISMKNIAYNPTSESIHVGDKVTWSNDEAGLYPPQHTASSDDGHTFDSGYLNPGQSYTFTFTKAGTFTFHCNVHSSMHGTITVIGSTPSPTRTLSPTPTLTRSRTKPAATATAKPTVVPVSPTPTSAVKPSPRVSAVTHVAPSSTPSRAVAATTTDASSQAGLTIGLIAGALVILGGGLLVARRRRTVP